MAQLRRDDIDRLFDFNVHIPTRTIFMGSEVDHDGELAEFFLKGMAMLEADHKVDNAITIIMNNIGGDDYHGLAIYDAIATSKCHITIKTYGHAMSMGAWILQAADERILAPRSTVMLHYGRSTIDSPASKREWDRLVELMEDTFIERIVKAKPRFTKKHLRQKMEVDWFLSAPEAVEYGLADKIL